MKLVARGMKETCKRHGGGVWLCRDPPAAVCLTPKALAGLPSALAELLSCCHGSRGAASALLPHPTHPWCPCSPLWNVAWSLS